MTRIVIGGAFCAILDNLEGVAELCDESGRTLGYFHPMVQGTGFEGTKAQSPFPDEEIARREQQRTGRPLKEILEDLDQS